MILAGFVFLLLLTGGSTNNFSEHPENEGKTEDGYTLDYHKTPKEKQMSEYIDWTHCSHADVINHLNLTDKVKYAMARPVKTYQTPTKVYIELYLYAILDVKEKEQKLVSYIWTKMWWYNEFISWRFQDFCKLYYVFLPVEMLWTPDIIIEEMTEKDKAYQSPYLKVDYSGRVFQRNGMVLVSSCRMHFYKFPFDTQTCQLTFKSVIFDVRDVVLERYSDGQLDLVLDDMQDRSEWVLVNTSFGTDNIKYFGYRSMGLVYSLTIKRRPLLYIVNFILPILFFLFLDLASFLISEHGGEKLSFKVTVLLAVTVMQLILNEILPSSSDRIPLIAVYCTGIFGLMMLSLLETILVMYLMERDTAPLDKEVEKDQSSSSEDLRGKLQNCLREINKLAHCARARNISSDETTSELQPVAKELHQRKHPYGDELWRIAIWISCLKMDPRMGTMSEYGVSVTLQKLPSPFNFNRKIFCSSTTTGSRSQLTEESCELDNLSRELREVKQLLSSQKEERRPGYWTGKIKMINRIYLGLYVSAAGNFLIFLFSRWVDEEKQ